MGRCPCSDDLRFDPVRRHRLIGFQDTWTVWDDWWGYDLILCAETPPIKRWGRTHVVCACEPGWVRIGASTAVIWGRNGPKLVEAFTEVSDPIVVVGLYPGTWRSGRALNTIQAMADRQGRALFVALFAAHQGVRTAQLEEPRVRQVDKRYRPL